MKRIAVSLAVLSLAACGGKTDAPAAPAPGSSAMSGGAMASSAPSGPNAGSAAPANAPAELMEGPAAGQWELTTEAMGRAMPPTKVCYGKMNISDMQKDQQKAGVTCSENKVEKTGDGYSMHSVCKSDATSVTTTSDSKVSGDLKTAYTMDMHMKMDPPTPGMPEMAMKITAKRLGDCEAGQVPLVPGAAAKPN